MNRDPGRSPSDKCPTHQEHIRFNRPEAQHATLEETRQKRTKELQALQAQLSASQQDLGRAQQEIKRLRARLAVGGAWTFIKTIVFVVCATLAWYGFTILLGTGPDRIYRFAGTLVGSVDQPTEPSDLMMFLFVTGLLAGAVRGPAFRS